MKNKQIAGLVVAAILFVFVCSMSMLVNHFVSGDKEKQKTNSFSSILSNANTMVSVPQTDFIGVVHVEGTIQGDENLGFGETQTYHHSQNIEFIDKMIESRTNKGIMIYVDSPGGTVYHSDELYLKLMEYKEKTDRPIWAYFASMACSGGYYVSMASDKIYANRNGEVGSIGVIMQLVNLKDLYDKIGIKEIDITSGKNKAMGSSGIDMTDEQKEILQSMVDEAYDQFVGIVSEGRGMSDSEVRTLADGRIYTPKQSKENGLIDEISDWKTAKQDFASEIGNTGITYYEPPTDNFSNLFGSLFSAYQSVKPKSDAELLTEYLEKKGNGVLMYYAE